MCHTHTPFAHKIPSKSVFQNFLSNFADRQTNRQTSRQTRRQTNVTMTTMKRNVKQLHFIKYYDKWQNLLTADVSEFFCQNKPDIKSQEQYSTVNSIFWPANEHTCADDNTRRLNDRLYSSCPHISALHTPRSFASTAKQRLCWLYAIVQPKWSTSFVGSRSYNRTRSSLRVGHRLLERLMKIDASRSPLSNVPRWVHMGAPQFRLRFSLLADTVRLINSHIIIIIIIIIICRLRSTVAYGQSAYSTRRGCT